MSGKHVKLSKLKKGDVFWYWSRGWQVMGKKSVKGKRLVRCVDDVGDVWLPDETPVEKLG